MLLVSSQLLSNRSASVVFSAASSRNKGPRLGRASGKKAMPLRVFRSPSSSSTTTKALPTSTTSTKYNASALVAAAAAPSSAPSPCPSEIRRRVIILPGLGNSDADYADLADLLRARGAAVRVARVSRVDWARNAAGLLRPEYWRGTLAPRPTVDWYLGRIDEALRLLDEEVAASAPGPQSRPSTLPPLTLLAHSAGGWLGRVWMLSGPPKAAEAAAEEPGGGSDATNASLVSSFVSVGSPHNPPPPSSSIPDQTRGILTWCERETPGAYHAEEHGVTYTTVASRYVRGAPLFGNGGGGGGSSGSRSDDGGGVDGVGVEEERVTIAQRLAGFGYEAVCGDPTAWGDGIVPVETAHLEGATAVTLEGVYHSPLGADESEGEGDEKQQSNDKAKKKRPWYGSEGVLEQWVDAVFGELPLAAAKATAEAAQVERETAM